MNHLKEHLDDSLKLKLQFFAEDNGTSDDDDDNNDDKGKDEEQDADDKKYSDDEVNDIINKKFKKWQQEKEKELKEKEDALEEAKKLEKMNADEKKEHERKKLEEELASYKKKEQRYQLSREASKMLADSDIQASDELLEMVVKDDAEATQSSVNAFVELFNSHVEAGVKKALSGTSPKNNANKENQTTKKFDELSYTEKVKLKKDNPELYQILLKERK